MKMMWYRRHVGKVYAPNGRVTSIARSLGEIPGCVPAPKDKGLLEEFKIQVESTGELYLSTILDYVAGNYVGVYPLWSRYWDEVKNQHGIGHSRYPGMA
jgi:hypothetical protein